MNNIPDIIYFEDNLFLNCPKCKQTAYIDFNKSDPNKININCLKCNNKTEQYLDDYMINLSILNSPTEVKCEKHNSYLDKYCYKCHIQFCSECDMQNHIDCSPIKNIIKIITNEKFDQIKKNINEYKENFKQYIKSYMDNYFINQPDVSKEIILESLISPYIQKMIFFFHFCECSLLNYNIDYPDFYQQMNLKIILSIFNKKVELMTFDSTNVENLFIYEDNNYISKNRVKLTFKETIKNINLPHNYNCFKFNNEIEIITSFEGATIYKNGNIIHTIKRKFDDIIIHKINDENFAIVQKKIDASISIFSTKYNEVISTKNYIVFKYIFNLDNNRFGITSSSYTQINRIEDKEVIKITEINMEKSNYEYQHSILIPGTNYIATLFRKEIRLKNKDDFTFVKSISIDEEDIFNHFYIDNSGRIFLGGYKIGIFDLKNLKVSILYSDNIKRFQGYLSGVETNIEYSDIVLTYFNRIVCKKFFKQISGSTYDDVPNTLLREDNEIFTFEFDPENNTVKLLESRKDIGAKTIDLYENNEIKISNNNGIHIYCID